MVSMKVVVLYRPESEHARDVETFVHDFQSRNPSVTVELQNVDTRDGVALASLYDIVRFPALLALAEDGSVLNIWNDDQLPLMDEVAAYAYMGR